MFITDASFAARLAFFAKVALALIAVEHVLWEALHTAVPTTGRAVNLIGDLHRPLTVVAHSSLALYQFLVVYPLRCQFLHQVYV